MLEIKNLTKIYKTKGGAETKALDNVSVSFPEKGLVFLLGKSGSGKSTLLNVAGGLDEPTSGEVLVMGKSSKEFTGSDFDSYRNTYVGFIFQEYNVLDEFTVEDNVALALELQGRKKDREQIDKILREVELGAFAKRKPNTLSGGQKQRVAIARALVKDPQIIMADEPTGALDSATGKQVFDTLKNLSKTRLVLVVSHDREFAEVYGDRIIELKDGKILSDVSKVRDTAETVSENVVKIGEDTLTVKGGAELTESTLREIENFLRASEGDVLLTKGEKDIANFRRANRIGEDGARERFDETPPQEAKEYDGEKTKFIRSRLPASKALRIGASGLKLKPFRLVLTILLSVASFIMFGLSSTMMLYNDRGVMVNSFLESGYEYLMLEKRYEVREQWWDDTYTYNRIAQFTPAEVSSWDEDAVGTYSIYISGISNIDTESDTQRYYNPTISSATVLPEGHTLRSKMIAGKYPTAADEICVSTYFLDCAINLHFYALDDNGELIKEPLTINKAEDLVGKRISTWRDTYTISGVFDSGSIPAKFDVLKNTGSGRNELADYMLYYTFQSYIEEGLHGLAFVTDEFVENNRKSSGGYEYIEYFDRCRQVHLIPSTQGEDIKICFSNEVRVYQTDPTEPQLPILLADETITALNRNQLIINAGTLRSYYFDYYAMNYIKESDEALEYDAYEVASRILEGWEETTEEEYEQAKVTVLEYMIAHPVTLTINTYGEYGDEYKLGDYEIVGVYYSDWNQDGFYCSQEFYDKSDVYIYQSQEETKYVPEEDATYDNVLLPFTRTSLALNRILDKLEVTDPDTDILYTLSNNLYREVGYANDLVAELSLVFLIVGLVLAIFSALLLFNFISISITNKRKEIGILRAVGARGMDVFKIFFSESGIIVGICTVLALIGTAILTAVLNTVLKASVGLDVTLFVFGPLPILLMIGIAAVIAFISTFLPVYFAARKKPVESIRAL